MEENPYKSPEAEAGARRWQLPVWAMAIGLALLSYTIPLVYGRVFGPDVSQFQIEALRWFVFPLGKLGLMPLSIPWHFHFGAGFLVHLFFWAAVLSIWRRRGASV